MWNELGPLQLRSRCSFWSTLSYWWVLQPCGQLHPVYDILDLEDRPTPKLQRCQEIHAACACLALTSIFSSSINPIPGKLWISEYALMSEDYSIRLRLLVEPTIFFSSLPWIGPACASQNGRRYQYPQNLHGSTSAETCQHTKPWDFGVTSAFRGCVILLSIAPSMHPPTIIPSIFVIFCLSSQFWEFQGLLFIWSRLPYHEPDISPWARVHHHRSCLWCWEPQAWYTSSTTWDKPTTVNWMADGARNGTFYLQSSSSLGIQYLLQKKWSISQ